MYEVCYKIIEEVKLKVNSFKLSYPFEEENVFYSNKGLNLQIKVWLGLIQTASLQTSQYSVLVIASAIFLS